ncbi:unnamed protein product, partial [Nesidiocoris tenuis]
MGGIRSSWHATAARVQYEKTRLRRLIAKVIEPGEKSAIVSRLEEMSGWPSGGLDIGANSGRPLRPARAAIWLSAQSCSTCTRARGRGRGRRTADTAASFAAPIGGEEAASLPPQPPRPRPAIRFPAFSPVFPGPRNPKWPRGI